VESISKERVQLKIEGIVQGVGFRPFVYQKAHLHSLNGFVLNDGGGVVVEVEGKKEDIEHFLSDLQADLPPLAKIERITELKIALQESQEFTIVSSCDSEVKTLIPVDQSLCDDCLREMNDPSNRRYKYPFINCTNCGPRYTIIESLPYDRKNSSMKDFRMCSTCAAEYSDPTNRRYHAEPISCFECGPKMKFISLLDERLLYEADAIKEAVKFLQEGKIIAVKGLGGFHIVCDATNEEAVRTLRREKHRATKPLAVMFDSLAEAKKVAIFSKKDEELLLSQERPIVVTQKRKSDLLAKSIAPNIDRIGLFLPYTPIHTLILEAFEKPIVATSANLSDEPIITDEKDILEKLSCVVDAVLTHDRSIVTACDDTVLMGYDDKTLFLRLGRGYGPKNFFLQKPVMQRIVTVGANQKNTFALVLNDNIILSPHIGDLNSLESIAYFEKSLKNFQNYYDFKPDVIVCDKHPRYESTLWAKAYVKEHQNVALIELQHHYAHALAVMAEYRLDRDVLAFCFDGTGYGDDGMLWGGEVLVASAQEYKRLYHFQNIHLLGGEKAVKEPRRVGLSLLFECFTLEEIFSMKLPLVESFSKKEIEIYHQMFMRGINTPQSSSVGRLFDGVYALSGFVDALGYEGESGLIMESLAKESHLQSAYSYTIEDNLIQYKKMICEILQEKSVKKIARKFLNTLVEIILEIAQKHPELPVLLAGGVFQNKMLVMSLKERFEELGIEYYIQEETPVNDGSIALGQAYYAVKKFKGSR